MDGDQSSWIRCPCCPEARYGDLGDLVWHLRNRPIQWNCPVEECQKLFVSARYLADHIERKHMPAKESAKESAPSAPAYNA